jgi:hypothetical protein
VTKEYLRLEERVTQIPTHFVQLLQGASPTTANAIHDLLQFNQDVDRLTTAVTAWPDDKRAWMAPILDHLRTNTMTLEEAFAAFALDKDADQVDALEAWVNDRPRTEAEEHDTSGVDSLPASYI